MPTPYDPHYDIRSPSRAELREISDRYGLSLEDDELAIFAEQIELSLSSYRRLRELPEPRPPVRYPRTPGTKATADANELNAWYWHCDITGSEHGLLRGRGVVVKDNVCLAGVPMSNGSAILEGYVPEVDATVVTRVLDAGGRIVGRAVGENFGVTSGSNTAATGSVLHPRNPAYSVGGSSSGCAALVAAGEAELAIGGDQGGSIRIPAALCGVVGLKPTYGLVPYTGIFPIEHSLDHVGPMATSVEDVAALLEVMAGADGFDPRQPTGLETQPYRECIGTDVSKLTIGVLTEAFDWPDGSDPRCDELIRDFAARIADIGARVEEISIPAHREAGHVAAPIYAEGIYGQLVLGRGLGRGWKGYYPTSLATVTGRGLRCGAQDLSATAKFFVLTGTYMTERYDGRYYGLAQNVARWLRCCYDEALERVDVLVMPTCAPEPKALPHIEKPGIAEVFQAGLRYHFNAGPFNITGHPAITIPAAEVDDLPVGMMIVGRAFGEATVLGVASAFENLR